MLIGAIKCKLCRKEILPEPELIGETKEKREQRIITRVLKHLQKRAEMEKGTPHAKPHLDAIAHAAQTCMNISANLNGALLTGNFELPEGLEHERLDLLRQVHDMTRQVRMTDEDLWKMSDLRAADCLSPEEWGAAYALLQDLRDRYEGLGKYAPVKPEPAAAPAEVKP